MLKLFRRRKGLSCDQVLEVLQSYLDGEIDAGTANKVAAHLDECTDCDLEAGVYDRIRTSLAARVEPVDAGVMSSLESFGARLAAGDIPDSDPDET